MFWALAFLSLGAALVLLNIFYSLIGDGLELLSLGKEAVIAGIASLIEAASLWLVVTFVPAGARAMIFPALVVALIYKVAHFEDWGRFEILLLLVFQYLRWLSGCILVFRPFPDSDDRPDCFWGGAGRRCRYCEEPLTGNKPGARAGNELLINRETAIEMSRGKFFETIEGINLL